MNLNFDTISLCGGRWFKGDSGNGVEDGKKRFFLFFARYFSNDF